MRHLRRNPNEADAEATISRIRHLSVYTKNTVIDIEDLIAIEDARLVPYNMSRGVSRLISQGIEINKLLNDYRESIKSVLRASEALI